MHPPIKFTALYRFHRPFLPPPVRLQTAMRTEICNNCSALMETKPQTVCELQVSSVSSILDNRSFLHPSLVTPGSLSTVSVSPDTRYSQAPPLNLFFPCACFDTQSKQCQKAHWNATHKAVCTANATVIQRFRESPGERGWSKKMMRWAKTWTHTIHHCFPIALDLANHEWGHHDAHVYVPSRFQPRVF